MLAKKEMEQRKKDETAALFAPIDIVQTKVPFGVGASLRTPRAARGRADDSAVQTPRRCFAHSSRPVAVRRVRWTPPGGDGEMLTGPTHARAGTKCKFSHDLNQERKQTKASIYADARDETKVADTMDKWNDEKLQEVVGRKTNSAITTDIVCKHFIDSVENGRYGWFWECPDGGALPRVRGGDAGS